MKMETNKAGGFIDYEPLKEIKTCNSLEHHPPTMILLPAGKHTYACPTCGYVTIVNIPKVN